MPLNRLEVGLALTQDTLTPGLARAGAAMRSMQGGFTGVARETTRGAGLMTRSITSLTRGVFNLRTAFLALGAAYGTANLISFTGRIEDVENAFVNLNRSLGNDSVQTLQSLQRATRGTISEFDAMQVSNRAFLLGSAKTSEELEVLATVARRLGRAMGTEVRASFDDIALAMGRLSPRILDNLGIIVSIEFANQKYAAAVGKTVEQLTEAEKRQAFMNNTMEASRKLLGFLGEDIVSLSDVWGKLTATLLNMGQDMLRGVGPVFKDVIGELSKSLEDSQPAILRFFADFAQSVQVVIPVLELMGSVLDKVVSGISRVAQYSAAASSGSRLSSSKVAVMEYARELMRTRDLYLDNEKNFRTAGGFEVDGTRNIPGAVPTGFDAQPLSVMLERIKASTKVTQEEREKLEELISERDKLNTLVDQLAAEELGRTLGNKPGGPNAPGSSAFDRIAQQLRDIADKRQKELEYRLLIERENKKLGPGGLAGPPNPDAIEGGLVIPGDKYLEDESGASVDLGRDVAGRNFDTAFDGILEGLEKIAAKSRDVFGQMRNLVLDVSDALVDGIAGGIVNIIDGTENLKDAIRNMTKAILRDLANILVRLALVRLIGFGAGALSNYFNAQTREIPASLGDDVYGPGQLIEPRPGDKTTVLPSQEPLLELGGTKSRLNFTDLSRVPNSPSGGGVTNINIQTIDAKTFDQYFQQSAARQPGVIGVTAMRQYQDNKTVRRGYK